MYIFDKSNIVAPTIVGLFQKIVYFRILTTTKSFLKNFNVLTLNFPVYAHNSSSVQTREIDWWFLLLSQHLP